MSENKSSNNQWVSDNARSSCAVCKKHFTLLFRRHHCRMCGEVVCGDCAPYRKFRSRRANSMVPSSQGQRAQSDVVRICTFCFLKHPSWDIPSRTQAAQHSFTPSEIVRNLCAAIRAEVRDVESLFRGADTNTDGRLDIYEFAQLLFELGIASHIAGSRSLRETFDAFDNDKNGYISISEFVATVNRVGEETQPQPQPQPPQQGLRKEPALLGALPMVSIARVMGAPARLTPKRSGTVALRRREIGVYSGALVGAAFVIRNLDLQASPAVLICLAAYFLATLFLWGDTQFETWRQKRPCNLEDDAPCDPRSPQNAQNEDDDREMLSQNEPGTRREILETIITGDQGACLHAIRYASVEELWDVVPSLLCICVSTPFWCQSHGVAVLTALRARTRVSADLLQQATWVAAGLSQQATDQLFFDQGCGVVQVCQFMQLLERAANGGRSELVLPNEMRVYHPFQVGFPPIRRVRVIRIFNSHSRPLLVVADHDSQQHDLTGIAEVGRANLGASNQQDESQKEGQSAYNHTRMTNGEDTTVNVPTSPRRVGRLFSAPVQTVQQPSATSNQNQKLSEQSDHPQPIPSNLGSNNTRLLSSEPKSLPLICPRTVSAPFIFKTGDDLRKDVAVMQVFRVFNRLWQRADLRYKQLPVRTMEFGVMAAGPFLGALEFVPDCQSLRKIRQLNNHLPLGALKQMVATGAGAYMAAFVLGVGDRHFDNILIRADGSLFHIDFAHILGQKVAFDTADIAVTLDFKQVLGQRYWADFVETCVSAFRVLRLHHSLIIAFAMLVFSPFAKHGGGFELDNVAEYLSHSLYLEVDIEAGCQRLRRQLRQAPHNKRTRFKNVLHGLATEDT